MWPANSSLFQAVFPGAFRPIGCCKKKSGKRLDCKVREKVFKKEELFKTASKSETGLIIAGEVLESVVTVSDFAELDDDPELTAENVHDGRK